MYDTGCTVDERQQEVLERAAESMALLRGPAGVGKTRVGIQWMLPVLETSLPAPETAGLSWTLVAQA